MSIEDFQLIHNELSDNSIIKIDFIRIHHQQGGLSMNSDEKIEMNSGENNNHHLRQNAYLQCFITIAKAAANPATRVFNITDSIRLINNAFADTFKDARLPTTKGADLEHNKKVGQIMRILPGKDGYLISYFDEFKETEARIRNSTWKQKFI